jgi:hypothetical protein
MKLLVTKYPRVWHFLTKMMSVCASNIQHTEVNLNNVTTGVENEVITDASVVEDLFL